jgi:vacuolar-type H+-ATPase subunit I/STV1
VIRRKHRKSKSKVSVVDRDVEKIGEAITDIHRKEEAATNAAAIAMDRTLLVDAMKEGDVAIATALQSIGGTLTKVDELEKRLTTGFAEMERRVEDINGKADMILGLLAKLV